MRRFGTCLAMIVVIAIATVAVGSSIAMAQGSSVRATFEKHGMLGTFAYDCSKPMGNGNFYFAVYARDDGHVQRDQMNGLGSTVLSSVFDQASELAPNKLSAIGTSNGVRSEIVWQLEAKRTHTLAYTLGDKKVIVDGKFANNGLDTRWINKCELPATLTNASIGGPGSVKAIFEKHNLLGTFADDCSKPAKAIDNWYYVDRLIDPDHVQRDLMESKTTRNARTIIDQAFEVIPNEIVVRGTRDDKPAAALWRTDKNRMMQWEAVVDGQPLISGGKWIKTQAKMPWISRCGD